MRIVALFAAVAALALWPFLALAADPAAVVVPWGDWLSAMIRPLGDALIAALLGVLTVAAARLPGWLRDILLTARAEQLLRRAAEYGIGVVDGAVKGRVAEVHVTNEVLREALAYAVRHAPDLVEKIGGNTLIREKLIPRLVEAGIIPPDASAKKLGVP